MADGSSQTIFAWCTSKGVNKLRLGEIVLAFSRVAVGASEALRHPLTAIVQANLDAPAIINDMEEAA